jgi:hypothetical protein
VPTASQNRWGLFPARFGDISLRQVDSLEIQPGSTKTEIIPGGNAHRAAVVTAYAEPIITCKTRDFDGLLTSPYIVDIQTGYRCGSEAGWSTLNTLIQYQRRKEGGLFSTTNTEHLIVTSPKGFLCFDEISAEQDSTVGAEASLRYYCLTDAWDTEPLDFEQDAAGLVNTPSFRGVWYLGPMYDESYGQIDGVLSVRVRPGIDFRTKRADGNAFATSGSIHTIMPEVRVRLSKLSNYYEITGGLLNHSAIVNGSNGIRFFLQKGSPGGHRLPYASTVHVKCTLVNGEMTAETLSVSGEDDASIEYVIRPTTALTLTKGNAIS